jgi:hypothetical protein
MSDTFRGRVYGSVVDHARDRSFPSEAKPWCAQCDKPVDEIHVSYPPEKVADCRIVAYCHGQSETSEFSARLMVDGSMTFGKAFLKPKAQLEEGI